MADADGTEEPPTRAGVQTRKANASKHPGRIAMEQLGLPVPGTTKRRTSQQVAADKEAAALEKAAKEADHQERIAKVARIELDMEHEDAEVIYVRFSQIFNFSFHF